MGLAWIFASEIWGLIFGRAFFWGGGGGWGLVGILRFFYLTFFSLVF